jgi:hypothetical protein
MTPAIANLIPLPTAIPAEANAVNTGDTGTGAAFQTVLTDATRQTPGVTESESAELPLSEDTPPETLPDTTNVNFTGALAFVAQFVVLPPNDATANSATLVPATAEQSAVSRAEALLQQQPGGVTTANFASPALAIPATETATANPQILATETLPPSSPNAELPAAPLSATTPATPRLDLARTVNDVLPAQRQVVIPQTPLAAGVLPSLPTPGTATGTPAPINGTLPTVAATSLPNVSVGNRPATAGEQFAAIASAAVPLAEEPAIVPTEVAFRTVLSEVAEVPETPTVVSATPAISDRELLQNVVESLRPAIATPTPSPANAPVLAVPALPANANIVLETATTTTPVTATAVPAADTRDVFTVNTLEIGATQEPREPNDSTQVNTLPGSPSPRETTTTAPTATVNATPTPQSPVPSAAFQMTERIAAFVRAGEQPGANEFQMRLDPPELGSIRIRLVSIGDQMRGTVVVADDAVRRMIESQMPELRHRLEEVGINVQQFDVATDSGSGNSGDGYRPEFANEWFPRMPVRGSVQPPRAVGSRESSVLDVNV